MGACTKLYLVLRKMESTSKVKIGKFLSSNFEFWNLKIEDMLVDRDLWVVVFGCKLLAMSQGD